MVLTNALIFIALALSIIALWVARRAEDRSGRAIIGLAKLFQEELSEHSKEITVVFKDQPCKQIGEGEKPGCMAANNEPQSEVRLASLLARHLNKGGE